MLTIVLTGAGDLAEAERAGAACLARARDAGDLFNKAVLLPRIADLSLFNHLCERVQVIPV